MKRSNHLLLSGLILGKLAVATLLLWSQGGQGISFQREAVASETDRGPQGPEKKEPNVGDAPSGEFKGVLELKAQVEKEKENLRREREELLTIQEEINRKLADLSKVRNDIKAQMEMKKSQNDQRMKHLVKVYSAMKPQAAAGLIEKLELPFAVEVLARMQGDTVGNILSFVDKEKAARICQGLVKPR